MKNIRLSRILKELPEGLLIHFVGQTKDLLPDVESQKRIKEIWENIIDKQYPEGRDTIFEDEEKKT